MADNKKKEKTEKDINKEIRIIDIHIDLLSLKYNHHVNTSTQFLILCVSSFISFLIFIKTIFGIILFIIFFICVIQCWNQTSFRKEKGKEIEYLHNAKLKLLTEETIQIVPKRINRRTERIWFTIFFSILSAFALYYYYL